MDEKDFMMARVAFMQADGLQKAYQSMRKERVIISHLLKIKDKEVRDAIYQMLEEEHELFQIIEDLLHKTGRSLDSDLRKLEISLESQEPAPDEPLEDS